MWVKEAWLVISSRLLAFGLLGFLMMLATGCAGRTGTAQPQGVSEAISVGNQTPAPAPSAPQDTDTPSDELLDPFAGAHEEAGEEYDPWEPVNVHIFEFNRQFDRFLLKPVARGYNFLLPDWVQISISNLFTTVSTALFEQRVSRVKGQASKWDGSS
jgi:phospholipid-binding lipoprotein MlaA